MIDTKINRKNCAGCSACSTICSKNAITLVEDFKGFLYPTVDKNKCVNCGLCLSVCPQLGDKPNDKREYEVYKVTMKDKEDQLNSQSGGAFYIIARQFIEEGGIVYGVANKDPYTVATIRTDNLNDLQLLRKSKYVQPINENCFKQVIDDLRNNKKVLYSGLACHVQGLLNLCDVLKIDRKNLTTIDLICHGAPSPKIYRDHIKYVSKKEKCKPVNVIHRDKQYGWVTNILTIEFENNKKVLSRYHQILFSKSYIAHERCFACKFTTPHRNSDITIGDFWSYPNINEEDQKYGISQVILRKEINHSNWKYGNIEKDNQKTLQYNLQSPTKKPKCFKTYEYFYEIFGYKFTLIFANKIRRTAKRILRKENIKY